jgi:uncharacterized protein (DUF2147 family)
MKRIIMMLTVAALMVAALTITSAGAFAASPSQRACEDAGGTFSRDGGQVQCIQTEEGKNPKFTDTTTTSGQGNISNKQQQSEECAGTGSGKCPPGQF